MKNGFTIVELIIVVIIIGILASIGLTQYNKVVEKGRASEARMILGTLRSAEIAEYTENGSYVVLASLGVAAPADCSQTTHFFSYACTTAAGQCTATRCGTGTGKTPGSAIAYTKTLDASGAWGGSAGY